MFTQCHCQRFRIKKYVQGVKNKMENIIAFIFLSFGTVWDVKRKAVSGKYLVVWGFTNLFYLCVRGLIVGNGEILVQALWGVLPGVICLFLAYVTREQIGYGDGWVMVLVGVVFGIKKTVIMVFTSMTILTCFSVVLLVAKKAGRKTSIPFIPFLLLGSVMIMIGEKFL